MVYAGAVAGRSGAGGEGVGLVRLSAEQIAGDGVLRGGDPAIGFAAFMHSHEVALAQHVTGRRIRIARRGGAALHRKCGYLPQIAKVGTDAHRESEYDG